MDRFVAIPPPEHGLPVIVPVPIAAIRGIGLYECQTTDAWVEAQMREFARAARRTARMPTTANREMRGWWRADLPPVTSTGERLVLRLHATTMQDFMLDASGLDAALAAARTVLVVDEPQNDVFEQQRFGYRLRDNVRALYDGSAELAYVVPSIEFSNRDGARRIYFPYEGTAPYSYPAPCRIGAIEFERDPNAPPGPIFSWHLLSLLANDRFGQLREAVFARAGVSSVKACQFVNDSTIVPASRLLAQSQSFGGGALAPGVRMLRYYGCDPCTPDAVERAAAHTETFCNTRCRGYAQLVRENLTRAIANGVFCRPEPDPVTLEQRAPAEFRQPGMIALVPVVDVYRSPPHHDSPPTQDMRTLRAVCLNRGDLIRSIRDTPAIDPVTREAFFGIPMTVEEWETQEHGVGFIDQASANALCKRPERVFALIATGYRTLDGNVSTWRRNPFEVGAMHGQARRTFAVRPFPA